MVTLSHQTLINIVNSRLGKVTLDDLCKRLHISMPMHMEWISFMANEGECSKLSMTRLLQAVDVIVTYGDGTPRTGKIIAKFKGKTADEFIDYINKNEIKASVFKVSGVSRDLVAYKEKDRDEDPILGWVPDGVRGDPYVALGID